MRDPLENHFGSTSALPPETELYEDREPKDVELTLIDSTEHDISTEQLNKVMESLE